MKTVLFLCSIQYILIEGLRLAPYLPSLAPASERAKFLQVVAAQGDAAFIGFIHKSDPLAWASGDGWRRVHGTTALHAAAATGNAMAVRALIALGANVGAVDDEGRTALHITARRHDALAATFELLDAGAEVDATTPTGVTPLMEAVRHDTVNSVNALLHAGADRSKATDGGFSVIVQALQKMRSQKEYSYLSDKILGVNLVPDHSYSQCPRDWDVESLYLGSIGTNSTDSLFRTHLHKSCDIYPLDSSSMLNARDLFHRTPLHTAVSRNDRECVKKLLDLGADTDAVDWLKRTPLQLAKLCKFSKIENLLNSQA